MHTLSVRGVLFSIVIAVLVSFHVCDGQQTGTSTHWVGTWSTAPQLVETANNPPAPGLANNTLRQIVRVSLGGDSLRLRMSNEFSTSPVTIHAVHFALSKGGGTVDTTTDEPLSFNGKAEVVIAPGAAVTSDPFRCTVQPRTDCAITTYYGGTSASITGHPGSRTTSYILAGDALTRADFSGAVTTDHWYNINAIDVLAPSSAACIAILGNSITDGRGSTTNMQNRWPDIFSEALLKNPGTQQIGVINMGIGGNCVLAGGLGPTGVSRYDRDILGQQGVRWAIVFEGVNDIGGVTSAAAATTVAANLIAAYKLMIQKAHAKNIRIYGGTITPFNGNAYYNQYSELCRNTVNQWIRTPGNYDACIDFDKVMRNPRDTTRLVSSYQNDGLHPDAAGYVTMGQSIDLKLFLGVETGVLQETPDTVAVPGDILPSTGNLNAAVKAALSAKKLSRTVFKLSPAGKYVLNDSIVIPAGEHLTIVAAEPGTTQATAPPRILWSSTIDAIRAGYIIKSYGDLTLKNIWLLCSNDRGDRMSSCIAFISDPGDPIQRSCDLDGVVLDYFPCPPTAGGTITVACSHFRGSFKNSYWKNNTDDHFRYYGRAVSFPFNSTGWHGDSLVFENCTFANLGYVLMQEGGEYHNYVKFNHCTFMNVLMYVLESGWWQRLAVTNCLFENTYMMGDIPAYRYSPTYSMNEPNGGTLRIDSVASFGFAVPFSEQDRRILFANSNYFCEKWIRDWMLTNPTSSHYRSRGQADEIPIPQPMVSPATLRFFDSTSNGRKVFPLMNRVDVYDVAPPGFVLPPSDTAAIKSFLVRKWWDSSDTTWAWKPSNSMKGLWPLEENLAYTHETIRTAGMGGFPLGDLYRWWPEKFTAWKQQEQVENSTIARWLENGLTPVGVAAPATGDVPAGCSLGQNFPNPFNPMTTIRYTLPVTSVVSLKVYDLLGREAATVFEGERRPGSYETMFDGSRLASGMYFCRLRANNFVGTTKLVLLK